MYRRTRQRDGFLPDKRLNREITILSLLNHPHIVEYRYSGQVGQYQYILLEYVSNGTLSEYCAKAQGLKEKQVRKFARQIGSALQYCHTNLIVHGSLNADKVLITSAGDVKIAGFGTSTFNNGGGYEADTAAYGMLIWSMMSNERPIQFEDVLRYQLSPSASWGMLLLSIAFSCLISMADFHTRVLLPSTKLVSQRLCAKIRSKSCLGRSMDAFRSHRDSPVFRASTSTSCSTA